MASGEMSEIKFIAFLRTILAYLSEHSSDGSIHFVCMDSRHSFELLSAARPIYSELKNLCVWNKDNGGMGSLYRSKHELIFVFKNGSATHINNVELGRHGRNRTNVWDYAGVNSPRDGRLEELAMHPTVKRSRLWPSYSRLLQARQDCPRLLRRQRHDADRGQKDRPARLRDGA